METSFHDDHNGRLAYRVLGPESDPIVLLHGSNQSSHVFNELLSCLEKRRAQVVLIDLPGHGASGDCQDWSLPAQAAQIGRLLIKLRVKNATVVGASLGGHLAIHLLATGLSVKSLWLLATPPASKPLNLMAMYLPSELFGLLYAPERTPEQEHALASALQGGTPTAGTLKALSRVSLNFRNNFPRTFMRGEHENELVLLQRFTGEVNFGLAHQDAFTNNSYIEAIELPRKQLHYFACGHSIAQSCPQELDQRLFLKNRTVL